MPCKPARQHQTTWKPSGRCARMPCPSCLARTGESLKLCNLALADPWIVQLTSKSTERGCQVEPSWIYCAGQWQECLCGGRVKWGNGDLWKMIEPPKAKSLSAACSHHATFVMLQPCGGSACTHTKLFAGGQKHPQGGVQHRREAVGCFSWAAFVFVRWSGESCFNGSLQPYVGRSGHPDKLC